MVVTDGRTDGAKLAELLREAEGERLDFKETLDLRRPGKDELELIKDIVTMSNRPGGGYILVGVSDAGVPTAEPGTFRPRDFDGANLSSKVRKYIEGSVNLSTVVHQIGEPAREVVLICVHGHADGLPVPFARDGQYQPDGAKRSETVFRAGDLLVRDGPQNVAIRHSHWPSLLAKHDRLIRDEAQAAAHALIGEVVRQLHTNGPGSRNGVPLVLDMDEEAFAEAVVANLEAGRDIQLRKVLNAARSTVERSPDDAPAALDRLVIAAIQAVFYERTEAAELAIDTLLDAYTSLGVGADAQRRLDVVLRGYALGAAMVRRSSWELLPRLVHRTYPHPASSAPGYVYATWLRHGQVRASNDGLFQEDDDRGGLLVSATRKLLADRPQLRPDIPDEAVPDFTELAWGDELLNSLCQFDLLVGVMVNAQGEGHGGSYPSCAAFHGHRSMPVLERLVADEEMRHAVLPGVSDRVVAAAIVTTVRVAVRQSYQYGGVWGGLPVPVEKFITEQGIDEAALD